MPVHSTDKRLATDYEEEIQKLVKFVNQMAEELDTDTLDEIWKQLSKYQFSE